ncbi:MAG: HAD hydrolase family protein, partial [Candidatus Omnitrophota bacterium]|nr:HAD hydrolase family protein [Candidatus Omnitrophota bacterium]
MCHVTKLFQGARDKGDVYEKLLMIFKLTDEEVCFMGDELIDLPVMRRVGLAVAVPDSRADIISLADYVSKADAGRG